MKTSEKLLFILNALHQKYGQDGTKPVKMHGWDLRMIGFISSALPAVLWLESLGKEPILPLLGDVSMLEKLAFNHDPAHGTVFYGITAPLRAFLQSTPGFDISKVGHQTEDVYTHVGYTIMLVFGMNERLQLKHEAQRLINVPVTRQIPFGDVPDDGYTGWFKTQPDGRWLLRRGQARATHLAPQDRLLEFTLAVGDVVFVA